jgi:hypothetical protein
LAWLWLAEVIFSSNINLNDTVNLTHHWSHPPLMLAIPLRGPCHESPVAQVLVVRHHLCGYMKRVIFKFKHEPADDIKENQEWRNYSVREFTRVPIWVQLVGFAILATGVGIGFWVGGNPGVCIGLLAGIAACFLLVIAACPVRCPQCKGSVNTREVQEENGFKRFFHDYPVCKVSWKDAKRHWDSPDD